VRGRTPDVNSPVGPDFRVKQKRNAEVAKKISLFFMPLNISNAIRNGQSDYGLLKLDLIGETLHCRDGWQIIDAVLKK
jgi:hypothetical protein